MIPMRHYRVAERAKDAGIPISAGQVGQLEKLLDKGIGHGQIGVVIKLVGDEFAREQAVDRALKGGPRVAPSSLGHKS